MCGSQSTPLFWHSSPLGGPTAPSCSPWPPSGLRGGDQSPSMVSIIMVVKSMAAPASIPQQTIFKDLDLTYWFNTFPFPVQWLNAAMWLVRLRLILSILAVTAACWPDFWVGCPVVRVNTHLPSTTSVGLPHACPNNWQCLTNMWIFT